MWAWASGERMYASSRACPSAMMRLATASRAARSDVCSNSGAGPEPPPEVPLESLLDESHSDEPQLDEPHPRARLEAASDAPTSSRTTP